MKDVCLLPHVYEMSMIEMEVHSLLNFEIEMGFEIETKMNLKIVMLIRSR